MRRYVNLDNAASTSALAEVWEAVEDFLPWYSSVHRGAGPSRRWRPPHSREHATRSRVSSAAAERHDRLRAQHDEAINVLARATAGLARAHHAGGAPLEHAPVASARGEQLPFPASAEELLTACDAALRSAGPPVDLLAVTGASNVTGEVWPLAELARSPIGTGRASSSTPRSSRRIGRSTWPPPASTSWRCPATSSMRPSEQEHSSATQACSRSCRCFRAEARSAGHARRRRLGRGAGAPRGGLAEPARRSGAGGGVPTPVGLGMDTWPTPSALCSRACGRSPQLPGLETLTLWPEGSVDRVGVVAFNLAPYRTRCWPPCSAPSTPSACATAASVPSR